MKPAQLAVLGIALAAGAAALFLGSQFDRPAPPAPAPAPVVSTTPTVQVLVAKGNIGFGQTLTPQMVEWQTWTKPTVSENFITSEGKKNEQIGSIVRQPFVDGEPIREAKLVKANGSGFMAAILPQGKRAVSTAISAETGAGGFILPNDRVDVLMTKRDKSPTGGPDTITSQVVLSNIRVLAIDQTPREKDGQNAVLGRTATLELKPEEVEILAKAHAAGTLSLALRSMADRDVAAADGNGSLITIYRGTGGSEVLSCNPNCAR